MSTLNRRALVTGLIVCALAVLAVIGYLMWTGYYTSIGSAETRTQNYVTILDARLDATLRRVVGEFQNLTNETPPEYLSREVARRQRGAVNARLRSKLDHFPEIENLRIFDTRGELLYYSEERAIAQINIADRVHFRAALDDPQAKVIFSDVVISRTTGRRSLFALKAVRNRQGIVQGVVAATINLEFFQKLVQSLNIGAGGVAAIYRSDTYRQVLRWPQLPNKLNSELPLDHPVRMSLASGEKSGTYQFAAISDGTVRIYSHRILENFPFLVAVGEARDGVLANWKARSLIVGTAALFFMALCAAVTHLLLRTASAMEEQEASFGAAFNQAAVGMALGELNPHHRWYRTNAKLSDILGYTSADLLQKTPMDITPLDERETVTEAYATLLRGDATNAVREQRFIRKDGKDIWVRRTLSVISASRAGPAHVLSVIEDISVSKEAAKVRAYLAAIVSGSSDAIVGRALKCRTITSWNRAAEKLFGYSESEVIGQSGAILIPPDREEESRRNRELFAQGCAVNGLETVRLTKDGRRISVSLSQSPIYDDRGTTVGIALIFRDITEQQRAREALRETKESLAAIINASMDAIIAVDSDERIMIFSAAAEKLFLIGAADAVGQQLERFIPARFRANHHAHLRRFGEVGVTSRAMGQFSEVNALRADGTEFPIEASISHTRSRAGLIFTVTLRDITARRQAEAAQVSLEAQLRESQKMEAIGTLAGGIAHDFNNIIANILGNVTLAAEDAAAANPRVNESLDEIRKAAIRGRELVKQILTFSRRQSTERKYSVLNDVVHESGRLLRAMLPARVTLEIECDAGVPSVAADATQIQQVLINLVTNAMQAMRGKPGRVTVRLSIATLDAALLDAYPALRELREVPSARMVTLAVRDNGPGMDKATLEKIFEPFFTTKPAGEGTGLGLAVVHGIVKAHEGAIVVDSTPGMGATFTVYLPVAKAPVELPAQPAVAAAAPKAGDGRHVLYLDDDESMVFLVKRLLGRRGYRVSGYSNQQEALAALQANAAAFDLVVTDYNMPGMSGLDVARAVQLIRADLCVAVASGFVDEELQENAREAGVKEVLFKATELEDFCAVIERLL